MKRFFKNNGLTITFIVLFILALLGQTVFGLKEYNKELAENGAAAVGIWPYLQSGHFMETTFENWESEFLQMALFVVLTIFLQQKGSSESKDFDKEEDVDREPSADRKGAPWPVKKGGWILFVYKYSLTIAFTFLFLLSFVLHFYGSLKDENLEHSLKGEPLENTADYLLDSRFWFESFQNWQSEFLSVFAIVILSIYLRQIGSPQSKPVDAPHSETGD
jgi:Na+-transporting methylmalonyl-CoA/oxaloacetate decarboxylase gamma subunit